MDGRTEVLVRLRNVFKGRWRPWLLAAALSFGLAACGGGGGGAEADPESPSGGGSSPPPASREDAARFLTQASFGPTEASIDRVMAIGYSAWIDEQFALPATSHRATWDATDTVLKAAGGSAGQDQVFESFWKQAITGDDQLRQRVAFALSQIFVVSMVDNNVGDNPRAVAAWLDMLGDDGLKTYRTLLESVSRHPMMGYYLSHLRNQKADPRTGRVPDENYAREVMQLFSIGLAELNEDGTSKGTDTYGPADIAGLAKVFTGWSWDCPDWPDNGCFFNGSANGASKPDRQFLPMLGYAQYHSTDEKRFLGTVIAAQSPSAPDASLRTALDTLAAHPNVGPFIGKQLIQRLVTSNPSPAYVAAVSRRFADNGQGVRGDMKAVVKAILLHPEARTASATGGKVREPVLRLAAYLRAFPHASDSGRWRIGNTDSAATSLGQSPLRAPSVFNFYRPGYIAPGTQSAAAGLVAPELQIAHETSAAGYVNYMRDTVSGGVGATNSGFNRRDVQPDFSAEIALADQPAALVERVTTKLTYGTAPAALKTEITTAISAITIPAATGSNQTQIDNAKRNRVNAAVLLTLVSPEFQVQK
jgi:uncharacterized protein (DUF1800 family)